MKNKAIEFAYEMASVILTSITTIAIVFTFAFRLVGVSGTSMNATLDNGDWILVGTYYSEPEYKDIIVITQPNYSNNPLVKRIIAVGGQKVDIDFNEGIVYVDDVPLEEDYTNTLTTDRVMSQMDFPVYVPKGYVFAMGDNRNNSMDSRSKLVGFIDEQYILGRAIGRLIPVGSWAID